MRRNRTAAAEAAASTRIQTASRFPLVDCLLQRHVAPRQIRGDASGHGAGHGAGTSTAASNWRRRASSAIAAASPTASASQAPRLKVKKIAARAAPAATPANACTTTLATRHEAQREQDTHCREDPEAVPVPIGPDRRNGVAEADRRPMRAREQPRQERRMPRRRSRPRPAIAASRTSTYAAARRRASRADAGTATYTSAPLRLEHGAGVSAAPEARRRASQRPTRSGAPSDRHGRDAAVAGSTSWRTSAAIAATQSSASGAPAPTRSGSSRRLRKRSAGGRARRADAHAERTGVTARPRRGCGQLSQVRAWVRG